MVFVSCLAGTGPFSMVSAQEKADRSSAADESTRISWWICPTGAFSEEERVQLLVDEFEAENPQIDVQFRILPEEDGAKEIDQAFHSSDGSLNGEQPEEKDTAEAGTPDPGTSMDQPDVVLAPPEYLVTQWGSEGLMADLSGLWDERTQKEFRTEMKDAVRSRDDVWYGVPLYRDLYTMAINYDRFRDAGALQYLNEDAHSWKDSGYIDAVLRVHDDLEQSKAPGSVVSRVYCKDQTGQRAFMSFVSNFFNTGIVDEYHSSYQLGKGNIRNVFSTMKRLAGKGVEFDGGMDGRDENEAFLRQEIFMTYNWSAAKQIEAQDAGFRVFPMMYPNSKNTPKLTGPVGALGVTAQDDNEKMQAALSFVRFFMNDEDAYVDAVKTAGCFPARRSIGGHDLTGLYGGDQTMQLYEVLNEYYDDYMPVMELFPSLEADWPELIRKIADGGKVKSILKEENEKLNTELEESFGIHPVELDEEEG